MKSIKLKLILSSIVVVLLSVLVISVPVMVRQYNTLIKQTRESAEEKLAKAATDINLFLDRPVQIINMVVKYAQTHILEKDTIQPFLESCISQESYLTQLYVSGLTPYKDGGNFFVSNFRTWAPPSDYDQTTRPWYIDTQKSRNICFTNPFIDTVTSNPVVAVSHAIYQNGIFSGVAGIDIQLKNLHNNVAEIKISDSGKTYLLDKNGKYVTNEDTSKLMKINFFTEYGLEKYQNTISKDQVNFSLYAGNGLYFAGTKVSEESDWILVTVGPQAELFDEIYKSGLIVGVFAIISLTAAILTAFLLSEQIVRPLKIVDSTVNTIAKGDADLTKRIKVKTNDEIGSLVTGFNAFSEKLHAIIKDVKESKDELSDAGIKMQDSTDDTAASITQIIANIESMHNQINGQSASVEETAGAVNQIASNISSLEKMIETQSAGVTQASAAVEEMIGNIGSVNNSVEKMAESFNTLQTDAQTGSQKQKDVNGRIEQIEEQSKMLQEANQVIANIAAQTNLLAMNAAIEAAHAGEAGKGFSVVADEIRKLSETSTTQSNTIGKQLKKIEDSINSVVAASEESSTAFLSVAQKIHETDELVRLIKSAMQEQTEGSRQINDALHDMNDSTQEVRTASTEMSAGNKAILEEIKHLQDATMIMKDSMTEMSTGAKKINDTGVNLKDISEKMKDAIQKIGLQIDLFKV